MTFKKRYIEEAFKDWAVPAALGAGATMMAQHEFADDQGGSDSWNWLMDKAKQGAEAIKFNDNSDINGEQDTSKLKEVVGETPQKTDTIPDSHPKVQPSPEVSNQPGQHERTINSSGEVSPAKSTNKIDVNQTVNTDTNSSSEQTPSSSTFKSRYA
jgi:hypothetical protein